MSDKPFDRLWEFEQRVRRAIPTGMDDGVMLTIEYVSGFEKFNTRPYHNYETWGQGWRISDGTVTVEREDLDDAWRDYCRKAERTDRFDDEA